MSKKYKVLCDNHFMGYYHSTDPLEAVKKAVKQHWGFKPGIYLDKSAIFSAQKGSMGKKYEFTWGNFPELYPHIDEDCYEV